MCMNHSYFMTKARNMQGIRVFLQVLGRRGSGLKGAYT